MQEFCYDEEIWDDPFSAILGKFPSAELSRLPTPIHKLARLSAHLGCNIYIMRDDLTGFGLGGNKVRKLDYLIGDALAKKADTLVSKKASSFTRNAAVAGKTCGCEVHVVIPGDEAEHNPASRAFFEQFDTRLHYARSHDEAALQEVYDRLVISLRSQGKKVYELHPGGSDTIGALGYANAFREIWHYSCCSSVHFDTIFHPTGSTGTHAGLLVGKCISGYKTDIIGVAVSQKTEVQTGRIRDLAGPTAHKLDLPFDPAEIHVDDRFIGSGYAIPSEEGMRAVRMFAEMEGILLDQVYTGKAAAGLLYYAEHHLFGEGENVLFIHTGGNAGMFY